MFVRGLCQQLECDQLVVCGRQRFDLRLELTLVSGVLPSVAAVTSRHPGNSRYLSRVVECSISNRCVIERFL